jgi:hypothetical protein
MLLAILVITDDPVDGVLLQCEQEEELKEP